MTRRSRLVVPAILLAAVICAGAARPPATGTWRPVDATRAAATAPGTRLFETSDVCVSCHSGLIAASGEDVSFDSHWRRSMMANAARDPYWQAAVRREVTDHPHAAAAIEKECGTCHMPMGHVQALADGQNASVFAHLPVGASVAMLARLAADGVSCVLCHRIGAERLGTRPSFTGRFAIEAEPAWGRRRALGPFDVDPGRARIMESASGFLPARASHIGESEVCATCHTLYTHALGADGTEVGELPEQVPYLEWRHSAYRENTSCQTCHMPAMDEPVAVTSVWGTPRLEVSRHDFRGGNALVPRLLNRHRAELGVVASPAELDAAAAGAAAHLQARTAGLSIEADAMEGRLLFGVVVENRAGHKLPTAYPSRRVWLHVTVRDAGGGLVFESGALDGGRIAGNDNDEDGTRFEPHHAEITRPDQVQIYESILADAEGAVTTGLLRAVRYVKDNRLLPAGFDKGSAHDDIAVRGGARDDSDFVAGRDRVRYRLAMPDRDGPYRIEAELWHQPIGFRWADNLRAVAAPETARFAEYYGEMAGASAVLVARTATTLARATAASPARATRRKAP